MKQSIFQIALLVEDYDEAITFYKEVMLFELVIDEKRSETKRWVVMKPDGSDNFSILLAKAKNDEQSKFVGNQTGDRVFLFMHTDNFDAYHKHLASHNIEFIGQPRVEEYGKVVVFKDLYGNKWDLIQPPI